MSFSSTRSSLKKSNFLSKIKSDVQVDSLCPKRSSGSSDGSTRVVNQLLTELDGVEGRAGVWVLAATNRPDILDPAVMRPGRLDKTLFVGFPAPSERVEILGAITKGGSKPRLGAGLSLHALGMDARCDGFSGADMGNLVREASMAALREAIRGGATSKSEALVEERHFEKAFASVKPSVGEKERARYEVLKAKYGHGVEEDETATIKKTMSVHSSPATGHQNVTSNSISLSPGLSNDAATTPKAALSFTPSSSSNNSSMFGGSSKPVEGSVFGGAAAPFKPAGNPFSTPASNVFSPSSKSSAEASSSSSIFSTVFPAGSPKLSPNGENMFDAPSQLLQKKDGIEDETEHDMESTSSEARTECEIDPKVMAGQMCEDILGGRASKQILDSSTNSSEGLFLTGEKQCELRFLPNMVVMVKDGAKVDATSGSLALFSV